MTLLAALIIGGCGMSSSQTASTASSYGVLGRVMATVPAATATSTNSKSANPPSTRTTVDYTAGVQGWCHYQAYSDGAIVPDPSCTPGALNPAAVANPRGTICVPGYSERIRPPESYTEPLKIKDMVRYASAGPPSSYEEDHLVALEDGGSPRNPTNLWPEYLYGAGGALQKDKVENTIHALICAGKISVMRGASLLEGDWKHLPPNG